MTIQNIKNFRTTVIYLFAIQLLLYSNVISGYDTSTNTPSGAEFLRNVIGNLHRPYRKIPNDRIDVEEHLNDDIPNTSQSDEVNILSKQPFVFTGQNNQATSQVMTNANNNQGESMFSQFVPQMLKNELGDTQAKIVSQGSPQQSITLPQNVIEALSGDSVKPDGTISGYQYYFYPLDNKALQQLQQQQQQQQQQYGNGAQNGYNGLQQAAAGDQNSAGSAYAVQESSNAENQVTKHKVEPLFVAMAGFVGVAVVFLSAMMFIPRLPIPTLNTKSVLKRAPEEIASLTKLVAESIDGKDCSERIACEVGRAMRSMRVGNKPIRMMEIILPPSVAKQLAQIRRSASRKEQCHFIMCKKTENTLKMVAKLKKSTNNNNNKTIHDVRDIFEF